jgi:hypothetical protein
MNDTRPEIEAIQIGIQRGMSGEQRLLIAFEMSTFARQLSMARLRTEHPDWSDAELSRELLRDAFLPGRPPWERDERS